MGRHPKNGDSGSASDGSSQKTWKQDTLSGLARGSQVWVKTAESEWTAATLQSVGDIKCTILLENNPAKVAEVPAANVVPANPDLLDCVDDLTGLSYLNEPSILHDLHRRYSTGGIYTLAGPVLIAVNPLRTVPLYSSHIVEEYAQRDCKEGAVRDVDPHVFLTADDAYKAMRRQNRSQSLVISGESGAGKTETTKIAMQYLAGLSGGTGVEERVLATNPLLEAFGNAKTLRNNNSSRFGKLIDIHFNTSFSICGARIQTYLLEKSRVAHQLPGERNYHIFYQMCRGLPTKEAAQYLLPSDAIESFRYLSSSGCTVIQGTNDAEEFGEVRRAMEAVGLGEDEQDLIFSLLSGVLWLGNIEFEAASEESVTVCLDEALKNAADLLGVPPAALAAALCSRNITAGGGQKGSEQISVGLTLEAANDARDALAKALYSALFGWLVEKINDALAVHSKAAAVRLSILDIYGFECFKENSFEQLCINYANERLQQLFNRHLFKLEQEAYESEGIDWTHVEFEDNQACVDLIEGRPPNPVGIISLLDEECMFPRGSDLSFGSKLRENLGRRQRFAFDPRRSALHFAVDHYAGRVNYSCGKILYKNRDTLSSNIASLVLGSEHELVAELAPELSAASERRRKGTVAARFREQLRDLVCRLEESELHFVRCIKPNNAAVAGAFEAPVVLHQLRCCGVLEVTRIARAGYPTRFSHLHFAERFQMLLPGFKAGQQQQLSSQEALRATQQMLEHFRVDVSLFQIGRTKIFLRAGVLGSLEDRRSRILRAVITLQSTWRMLGPRQEFKQLRGTTIGMQARVRAWQARRLVQELRLANFAASMIQAHWRGFWMRQSFLTLRDAAVTLQCGFRRWQLNRRVATRTAFLRQMRLDSEMQEALRQKATAEKAEREQEVIRNIYRPQRNLQSQANVIKNSRRSMDSAHSTGSAAEILAPAPVGGGVYATDNGTPNSEASSDLRNGSLYPEHTADPVGKSKLHADSFGNRLLSSAAYRQIEMWEDYANKLEEQMRQVLAENAGLRVALAEAQRTIAEAPLSVEWSEVWRRAQEKQVAVGTHLESNGSSPNSREEGRIMAGKVLGDADLRHEANSAAARKYVHALSHELDRKGALFEDDASFVIEVKEGCSSAPGMDPHSELRTLKARFIAFKRDFKIRLGAAAEILRRLDQQEKQTSVAPQVITADRQKGGIESGFGAYGASAAEVDKVHRKKVGELLKMPFFSRQRAAHA